MADTEDIDANDARRTKGRNRSTNKGKRKKNDTSSSLEILGADEKVARIEDLEKELEGLFEYYKEVKNERIRVEVSECGSRNSVIAVLMEESEFPLSRLVDEIYGTLEKMEDPVNVTRASVKNSVLSVGQRISYGVLNSDADILEDDSESCFWCWETRDEKLIPESVRGQFAVRRICRRRIHERIMAISDMISSLKKPECEQKSDHGLANASATKLGKTYSEPDIRFLVDRLMQKNSVDMAPKKAKREEKLILKQLDRQRKEVDKGNNCMHNELQRELLGENDLKMIPDVNCSEKDIFKKKKQKKEPKETEKDRRRQEKKEAELKEKCSLQKQASLMERFLKRNNTSHPFQDDQFSSKSIACDSSIRKSSNVCESATISMDNTVASSIGITLEDIRKSHFSSWRHIGQSIRSKRKQGWGIRRKPKSELFKELKLAAIGVAHNDDLAMEKLVDGLEEHSSDIRSSPTNAHSSHRDAKKCSQGKQLLQFDNSHRPAFYGIWSKIGQVVGPRHPFRKEPSLDYDVDSDAEWEEEDPGESLSDSDKDEVECSDECSKSDNEDEDGFFVPDGYLSEDEGAQLDKTETGINVERPESSTSCKDDEESKEFCALIRRQKYLSNLTEHTLKMNRPLIIPNFVHEKELDQNISGTSKAEQMCLQSLTMLASPGSSSITVDKTQDGDKKACPSIGKNDACRISDVDTMLDSNLYLPLIDPLTKVTLQVTKKQQIPSNSTVN